MPKTCLSLLCALALLLGMTACGSRSAERQSDAAQPTVEERTPAGSVDELPIPRGEDTTEAENLEDAAKLEEDAKPEEDAAADVPEKPSEAVQETPQPANPETPQPANPETPQPSDSGSEAVSGLDAQIAAIRTQYQDIVFDTNLEVRTFGDAATVYLRDGEIVSVAAYYMEDPDAISPKSWTEHYYFNGSSGAPFFAFIERTGYDGWSELRLYFDGRTLLRWIEDDGTPHDNDQSSDYADYYYEEGCLAYANALAALSQ